MTWAVFTAIASVLLGLTTLALAAMWWRERQRSSPSGAPVGAPDVAALFALRPEPAAPLDSRLQQALAQLSRSLTEHAVLARVPLAQFLGVSPPQQSPWSTLVGQLIVDLLVCDAQGRPVLALDLPPATESGKASQLRRQKMRVVESAGIASLSLPAQEVLDVDALRDLLRTPGRPSRPRTAHPAPSGTPREGGKMAEVIPVAEALEMSAEDLPEFAPTTIFRPEEAVLPPRS